MNKQAVKAYIALIVGVVLFLGLILAIKPQANNTNKSNVQETGEEVESTRITTTTESIPYKTTYVDDSSLEYGKTSVKVVGKAGVKTYTYKITTKGGETISKELVGSEVTTEPIDEVIRKGTRIIWRCVDVTSYDYNWNNDMRCKSSTGETRYTSYSGAARLESQ